MYGIVNHELQIIAVHDDKEIVKKFIEQEQLDNNLVKIKKKNISKYDDLYLMKCGDKFIPYYLFETYKNMSMEYTYDLENCKNVLYNILEDNKSKKDIKAISRVISILDNEISECSNVDINILKEFKDINDEYKRKVGYHD